MYDNLITLLIIRLQMSDLCINSDINTTVNNLNGFITVYIAFCCINM